MTNFVSGSEILPIQIMTAIYDDYDYDVEVTVALVFSDNQAVVVVMMDIRLCAVVLYWW